MDSQERKVPVFRTENSLIDQEFDSIRDKFEAEMRKMEEEMARFRSQLLATSAEKQQQQHQQQTQSVTSSHAEQQAAAAAAASSKVTSLSTSQVNPSEQSVGGNISSSIGSSASLASSRVSSTVTSRTTTTKRRTTTKTIGVDDLDEGGSFMEPAAINTDTLNPSQHQPSWVNQLDSPLIKDDSDGQGKMLKLRFDVSQYQPDEIVVKTIDNRLQVHAKREEKTENSSRYLEYNREFLLPEGTDPERIRSSLSNDGVLTVEAPLPLAALRG